MGVNTDGNVETDTKIERSKRAYFKLVNAVGGVGYVHSNNLGDVFTAIVRTAMCFGVQSRGVSREQMGRMKIWDNTQLRRVAGYPLWRMMKEGVNSADLRYRLDVPPLDAWIYYTKASFFGHSIRRGPGHIAHDLFAGVFRIPMDDEHNDPLYRCINNVSLKSTNLSYKKTNVGVLDNIYEWLVQTAKIPLNLVFPVTKNKKLYYILTREAYLRSVYNDLKLSHVNASKIEERMTYLREKFGIENKKLDSYKQFQQSFDNSICFICKDLAGQIVDRRKRRLAIENKNNNGILVTQNDSDDFCKDTLPHEDFFDGNFIFGEERSLISHLCSNHCVDDEALEKACLEEVNERTALLVEQEEKDFIETNKQITSKDATFSFNLGNGETQRATRLLSCNICNIGFETSVGSLKAHLDQHKFLEANHNKILNATSIYRYKRGGKFFRPREHLIGPKGNFFPGSQTKFVKHVIKDSRYSRVDKRISCHNVGCSFNVSYDVSSGTNKQVTHAVAAFNTHLSKCKHKNKGGEKK